MMATPGQWLENPFTGERIVFIETAQETKGTRVVIDHFLPPHTDTFPEHLQLNQEERFEIIAGSASYSIGRVQHQASAGDVIVVPAGTPHRNPWNSSAAALHFRHQTTPDLGSEQFFETIFSLARDGKTNRKGEVPLLHLMVIGDALASKTYQTGIPISVQRVAIRILAALGRRLGYRPHYP
jgi:mannose-6-phosphate isomerase-like protein (cupin superfamily)